MSKTEVFIRVPQIGFGVPSNFQIFEGFSKNVEINLASVNFLAPKVNILEQQNLQVTINHLEKVGFFVPSPSIEIFSYRHISTPRRFHRSAWQARLGAKLDPIKRKLIDNEILLTSHPTDMLRIRTKKDPRTRDLISRTITSVEVLPIVLPVLEDVPMKRIRREDGKLVLSFSMMNEDRRIEAYAPLEARLESDDLLFRIIKDEFSDEPYYMVMQVKEELGTIAYSSLLHMKYNLSFYDEELPEPIIEQLAAFAERREILEW